MVSSMREFDFIVIGSVTAGQKAAIQSAKSGKNVCLVETTSQVGGMCVHQGTILSKALREKSAQRYMNAHKLLNTDQPTELPSLMANGDRVIQGHDEYISAQLKRISIDCIESRASLKDTGSLDSLLQDLNLGNQKTLRSIMSTCSIATLFSQ